jgi:GNAT superfamily N-acetyltransferase
MTSETVETFDEGECLRLEAFLADRIYEFNVDATGYADGQLLGGCVRDEAGEIIGGFNGHTWGGCCELAHLWVHASHRGRGLGRTLLQAAEATARDRRCEQIVLSTHSFQAPAFYEGCGYERIAVIDGRPTGHANIFYRKRL